MRDSRRTAKAGRRFIGRDLLLIERRFTERGLAAGRAYRRVGFEQPGGRVAGDRPRVLLRGRFWVNPRGGPSGGEVASGLLPMTGEPGRTRPTPKETP